MRGAGAGVSQANQLGALEAPRRLAEEQTEHALLDGVKRASASAVGTAEASMVLSVPIMGMLVPNLGTCQALRA